MRVQLLRDPLERMPVAEHLHRPIRPDHQQAGRLFASREEGQPVKGGDIAPVQVFQHTAPAVAPWSLPLSLRPTPATSAPWLPRPSYPAEP